MSRRSLHEARFLNRPVDIIVNLAERGQVAAGRLAPVTGVTPTLFRMQGGNGTPAGGPPPRTALVPTRAPGTGFTRPEAEEDVIYGEAVEPDVTRSPLAVPRRRSRSNSPTGFEPSPKGGAAPRHIAAVWLFGLLLIAGLLHWNHAPDLRADQLGQFLSESRAFAEQRPLTDIGLVATRFEPTIDVAWQPPGFALIASLAVMTGGDVISIMRVPTALALIALTILAFVYVKRTDGFMMALAVSAWCATALLSQHAVDTPLPELFWVALAWAAFLVAGHTRFFSPGRTATLGILVVGSLLFQRSALALIPALAIAALVRPEPQRRSLALVAVIATLAGISLLLFPRQTWLIGSLARSPGQLATDLALNILSLAEGVQAAYLSPFPWRSANLTWHALAILMTTFGAVELVKRDRFRLAVIFAAGYVAFGVLAASRTRSDAWVLWPLQLQALAYGAWLLAHRQATPQASLRRLRLAAIGVVLLLTAGTWRSLATHRPPRLLRISPLLDITEQLRARGSARVAFFSPRMLTWETRLAAMPLFTASPDETVAELRERQITHVILGDLNTGTSGAVSMARAVAARPDAFRRAHDNGAFSLYDVVYP